VVADPLAAAVAAVGVAASSVAEHEVVAASSAAGREVVAAVVEQSVVVAAAVDRWSLHLGKCGEQIKNYCIRTDFGLMRVRIRKPCRILFTNLTDLRSESVSLILSGFLALEN
jgi:hypothetical protein